MSLLTSRRRLLQGAAALAGATAVDSLLPERARAGFVNAPDDPTAASQRVLRFAHPTDIHVQPELHGGAGMTAAFRHMMSLADPPAMILSGGDLPMDTASTEHVRSAMLWNLFTKTLAETVPANVPIHHTIGNHDIWGRDMAACKATGKEPDYLKKWFLEIFGYKSTYYSFDQAGWHFIVLDSFDLDSSDKDFTARIVGEQLDWLKGDLSAASMPIVVVTHVPIISTVNFFEHPINDGPNTDISRTRMHTDHKELESLLRESGKVKLCLAGHIHLLDRVEYNGITYICDGAVCGDKWKGPRRQTPEGYGLIDLYADGTFRHQYVEYGWKIDPAEVAAAKKKEKSQAGKEY